MNNRKTPKTLFYFIESVLLAYVISLIIRGIRHMTPSDINKRSGAKPSSSQINAPKYSNEKNTNLPKSFDPRGENYMDPVKNQGSCGSCVAHACASGLSISYKKQNPNDEILNLSPQYILSCKKTEENNTKNPCVGTSLNTTLHNIKQEKGIPLEDECSYEYQFTGSDDTSKSNTKCKIVKPPSQQTQTIIKASCLFIIALLCICIIIVVTKFKHKTIPLTFLLLLFCVIGSLLPSFIKTRSTKSVEILFYLIIGLILILGSSANFTFAKSKNLKTTGIQLFLVIIFSGFLEIFYRDLFKIQSNLNNFLKHFDIFEFFIRQMSTDCYKSNIDVCTTTYSPIFKLKQWKTVDISKFKTCIHQYGHVLNSSQFGNNKLKRHAIVLVGWDDTRTDGKTWLYKNSWGVSYNGKIDDHVYSSSDGYGYISNDKLENIGYVITDTHKITS
tara:strand:- start:215 stop:1546 length:1332 start_codon:yes stop_codon:yes gene_type:complete